MKASFLLLAILFSISIYSQEEVLLKGIIKAESLEESSIHIINLTQRSGTVNNSSGEFQIKVQVNDTLVFSSVQFKKKKIRVTSEIYNKAFIEVVLIEEINDLGEMKISDIALTGNINTDLSSFEVVRDLPYNINFGDVKNARFEADINDAQSIPENLAFQQNQIIKPGGPGASVNLLAVAGVISNLLGLKKDSAKPFYAGKSISAKDQLRKLYDDDFFKSTLGIKEDSIDDFLYFVDENGLDAQMLRKENGLVLMEFLLEKSKLYKEMRRAE